MHIFKNALGKVSLQCVVHGQAFPLITFMIRDHDLVFPLIMGLEFLTLSGMKLDFATTSYKFPKEEELPYFTNPPDLKLAVTLPSST